MILNSLKLKATRVFEDNHNAKTRLVVNQGGSRSSKTYSIAQLFIILGLQVQNTVFTISRKTTPALKATAMRDFFDILQTNDLYNENDHNKTESQYTIGSNLFEFVAVDQAQKIKGRKRHYLWMNEANEFKYEDYRQMALRTSKQIFMDYNPADQFHWLYEHILTRKDCTFIKSTYKDNPFLEQSLVEEIENYKNLDQNYWRIYGLGERGASEATIYSHWQYVDELPEVYDEKLYGLDFGYNNHTALVEIRIKDQNIYTKERIYKKYLTNSALIEEMKKEGIEMNVPIYADCAEPQRIQEIKNAGFWILPADKDVAKGIDSLQTRKWWITKDSVNMIKEVQSYKWKVKDEQVLDDPVKTNDHSMDATRYGVHTHLNQPFVGVI